MRRGEGLHAFQFLEAALGLLGLGGLVAEAAHEVIDFGYAALLLLEAGLLVGQALGAQALEVGVVALVGLQLLVLDLQDAPAGGVDEVAVVGNHQQGTGVLLQPLLQPQGRVQVQVIGRLVQQQHIRGRHQRPGQVEANTPAAGEIPHRPPGGVRVEAQPLQQALGPPLGAVAVYFLQLAVHARHRVVVAGRLLPLQFVPQGRQRAVPAPDILSRRQAGGVHLLRHVGQAQPGHALDVTGIGNQLPQQQGEQARFATAVGADQGQPLAGLDGDAGALQQQLAAPAQPDIA